MLCHRWCFFGSLNMDKEAFNLSYKWQYSKYSRIYDSWYEWCLIGGLTLRIHKNMFDKLKITFFDSNLSVKYISSLIKHQLLQADIRRWKVTLLIYLGLGYHTLFNKSQLGVLIIRSSMYLLFCENKIMT